MGTMAGKPRWKTGRELAYPVWTIVTPPRENGITDMAESTTPKSSRSAKAKATESAPADNRAEARSKFTAALEEAKAGVAALGREAQVQADTIKEKAMTKQADWQSEAKAYGDQAKAKAGELATQGKAKTSEALGAFGKAVSDNAGLIDDKLGEKYGDYARSAARSIQETAAKLDAKSVEDLGEDAKEFVRKSPGLAVGLAAVAGFVIARMMKGSND